MWAAQTKLKDAEKVRKFLVKKQLFNLGYQPVKELGLIYFPLNKKTKVSRAKVINTKITFPKRDKPPTIQDIIKNKLTKKEFSLIPKTQELVGRIMVLEVPPELKNKEKIIAQAYLKTNKNIETIVKKNKIHSGNYRLRKVKILAGKRSKETIYLENGVKIKLNLEKT